MEPIDTNIGTFSLLNVQIRNPLTIVAILTDGQEKGTGERILTRIRVIDSNINQPGQRWVESDKIRVFLLKQYGIITKPDPFHSLN